MSKTSDEYSIVIAAIVLELCDRFNLPEVEAMNLARDVVKRELSFKKKN